MNIPELGMVNPKMGISTNGLKVLKQFEGLRLKAYFDEAGVRTIGWGHTGLPWPGDKITEYQAEELLRHDLERFEQGVNRLVKVPLTQGQYDALVLFAFNVGLGGGPTGSPIGLEESTLLRKLNRGDYEGAYDQFLRWNKVRIGGFPTVSRGLTRRREAEQQLWRTG